MNKISVIVPTYNSEQYIEACLSTIANQITKPSEVIFVDDASSDNTVDRIKNLVKNFEIPTVVIRCTENRGPSAARNIGISHAKYPWISFLDSDDLWLKNHLSTLLFKAKESSSSFVFSSVKVVDCTSNVELLDSTSSDEQRLECDIVTDLYFHSFIMPSQVLVSRYAESSFIWFDENLRHGEDADCWIRLYHNGNKLIPTNLATCIYRKSPGSPSSDSVAICLSHSYRLRKYTSYNDFSPFYLRQQLVYSVLQAARICRSSSPLFASSLLICAFLSFIYPVSCLNLYINYLALYKQR